MKPKIAGPLDSLIWPAHPGHPGRFYSPCLELDRGVLRATLGVEGLRFFVVFSQLASKAFILAKADI